MAERRVRDIGLLDALEAHPGFELEGDVQDPQTGGLSTSSALGISPERYGELS